MLTRIFWALFFPSMRPSIHTSISICCGARCFPLNFEASLSESAPQSSRRDIGGNGVIQGTSKILRFLIIFTIGWSFPHGRTQMCCFLIISISTLWRRILHILSCTVGLSPESCHLLHPIHPCFILVPSFSPMKCGGLSFSNASWTFSANTLW